MAGAKARAKARKSTSEERTGGEGQKSGPGGSGPRSHRVICGAELDSGGGSPADPGAAPGAAGGPAAGGKTGIRWAVSGADRWEIGRLRPYDRNARTHSEEQIGQIAASMREWGWTNPILATAEGMIVAGHGRVRAAASLGESHVPVLVVSGWSEAQVRAYVLADNKLAELGSVFDVGLIGFSDDELTALLHPATRIGKTDPDEIPAIQPAPISVSGDLWTLGVHAVVCGDSTDVGVLERVLGAGQLADLVWTDPPYNVAYSSAAGSIANDDLPDAEFADFLAAAFGAMFACLKPGSAIYVAHADIEGLAFRGAFARAGFKLSSCLAWVKDSLVLGRSDYQSQHEPILYGWRPGAAHRWFGGRKQTTVAELGGSQTFSVAEDGSLVVRVGQESVLVRGEGLVVEAVQPTVLRVAKPKRSEEHPTMKPTELIGRMLLNSSRIGDIVLDPFGGSGSTLIAAEQHGRRARLVELEPRFVDVIVRRWEAFTGKSAVLEDGRTFSEVAAARRRAA